MTPVSGAFAEANTSPESSPSLERARELHRSSVVADLHIDILLTHDLLGYDIAKRHRNVVPRAPLVWQADLPRFRDAGIDIQGLGLVCSPLSSPRQRAGKIRRQLEYLHRVCDTHPGEIHVIRDRASLRDGLAAGRIGAFCGIEGAHALGGRIELLPMFHELGVRYMTFAHFSGNEACECAMGLGSRSGRDKGLTDFGRALLAECERLGIVVDLAHVNKRGFMEACAIAQKPVIVSHTGVTGVKNIWRNIDDEQIEAVAKNGGVIGVIFGPQFTGRTVFDDLWCVARHILHIVRVAGADHAAYGSDIDGWLWTMPAGMRGIDDLPRLTALLLDAGLDESDVKKIIGGNVARVVECALT